MTESPRAAGYDPSRLGQWSEWLSHTVDAERTKAYAASTNDDNPWHTSGKLAPPILAVSLAVDVWPTEIASLFGDDLYNLGSVHGEQDLYVVRPMQPGMTLRTRATVLGVHVKSTGTAAIGRAETYDEQGLLNYQYFNNYLRGFDPGQSAGEQAPGHRLAEEAKQQAPAERISYPVDIDQSIRFAAASGDHGEYHLTDEGARRHGFPSIIVHGVCTMAFAGRAVIQGVCADDPRRLKRLAVRFSAPLLPGQNVTTTIWPLGEAEGRARYGFETVGDDGVVVTTHGLAEVES